MKDMKQYSPGIIIGSKNPDELLYFSNCHTGITPNSKYVVRFETGETREFSESELVGPGFGNVSSLKLRSGQKVFVTNNGREVCGNVVYHRPQIDEVLINIPPTPGSNEVRHSLNLFYIVFKLSVVKVKLSVFSLISLFSFPKMRKRGK
jgi:hypothetical protein